MDKITALRTVLSFALALCLTAFSIKDDCKTSLIAALKNINKVSNASDESAFYLDYKITTTFNSNNKVLSNEDHFVLKFRNKKSALLSKEAEIYRDQHHQVSILPGEKTIVVTSALNEEFNRKKLKNIIQLQDSVISNSTVLECKQVTGTNKKLCKKITLDPGQAQSKRIGVERMSFFLDETSGEIKRINIGYLSSQKLNQLDMEIVEWNQSYTEEPFSGRALEKIYDSQGSVLVKYATYKIVDLTKGK